MITLRMDPLYKIDAPTKYFFNLEKKSVPQKQMGCLRKPGENISVAKPDKEGYF